MVDSAINRWFVFSVEAEERAEIHSFGLGHAPEADDLGVRVGLITSPVKNHAKAYFRGNTVTDTRII